MAFRLLVSALLVFCMALPAWCQSTVAIHPRLILLLVVDQFSYNYMDRFADKLSDKGFKFLQSHGAYFTNCRYKQATTLTAVGHSVISTGAYPWSTGVVGNDWYDRKKGTDLPAVYDDTVQLVGGNGQGASSHAMMGTTFGDELRLTSNGRSRVFSISLKDRSALFLSGKLANAAYWFDTRSGNFVSSSQYAAALPGWLNTFNERHLPDFYFGKAWQRLLPETAYSASTRDDSPYEGSLPGDGNSFPHILNGGVTAPSEPFYSTFATTPFADDVLAELARDILEHESLGQHADTDLLSVSFSGTDTVGHLFGPNSQEAEDTVLRLDLALGKLLQFVDQKIGLGNCLVVVTGDHGVLPVPEFLKERGQAQGLDAGRVDPKNFKTVLNSALASRLGAGDWISSVAPPNVYLNLSQVDKMKYRQPEVEALAAKLARSIAGIADVYTAAQFYTNQLPIGPMIDSVKRSYYWGRSGELYVVLKPGYIWSGGATGTSHGTPYAFDQQVPLIVCGPGVVPGRYGTDSSPADIAPTLSALLGIQVPALNEGRVLTEALGTVSGPPAPPLAMKRGANAL